MLFKLQLLIISISIVACQDGQVNAPTSASQQLAGSGNGGHYTGTEDFLRGSFLLPQRHHNFNQSCTEQDYLATSLEIRSQTTNFFLQQDSCPGTQERLSILEEVSFPLLKLPLNNFPKMMKVAGFEGRIYHHENSPQDEQDRIIATCRGIRTITNDSQTRLIILDIYLQRAFEEDDHNALLVASYLDINPDDDFSEAVNDEGDISSSPGGHSFGVGGQGISQDFGNSSGATLENAGEGRTLTRYDGETLFSEDVNASLYDLEVATYNQTGTSINMEFTYGEENLSLIINLTDDMSARYLEESSFAGVAQIANVDNLIFNNNSFSDLEMSCHLNY